MEATAPPLAPATGFSGLPYETHQVRSAHLTSTYAGPKLLDQGQTGSPQDLSPEGTVPSNPTPSGQRGMTSLLRGGSWPEAKEEKGVIQTHTMTVHTLSISRTRGPLTPKALAS